MDQLRITATAHGLNYLPEYHAKSTGQFAQLGLDVTAVARDPWTGVLDDLASGAADVALGGLWGPAMYAGRARNLVVVGQLNGRFPMAVVTREAVTGFEWTWMRRKTVLVPGAGGLAPYTFTEGLMKEAGVDPAESRFIRDLSTAMLAELFETGLGDAIVVDLLTATELHLRGAGSVACRLADAGGPMPNSVYYVRRDRLAELGDRLVRMLVGVRTSMAELTSGQADTSSLVTKEFPAASPAALTKATAELSGSGTWCGIRIEPRACERWVAILTDAGLVNRDVPYAELVDVTAINQAEKTAEE